VRDGGAAGGRDGGLCVREAEPEGAVARVSSGRPSRKECYAGVQAVSGGTTPILGDTFLWSAYVVFDQDNGDVLLAPYRNCGTRERTLTAGNGAAGNFAGECALPNAAAGLLLGEGLGWR
jgi:hypothetical protein